MHDNATNNSVLVANSDELRTLKGAIHFLARVLPLIFEGKDFFMRSMWHEQAFFSNQVNALTMMEAISLLLFKPGFTIMALPPDVQPQYYGKYSKLKA